MVLLLGGANFWDFSPYVLINGWQLNSSINLPLQSLSNGGGSTISCYEDTGRYIHTYIHTCIYMHTYIHTYTYIHRERERERESNFDEILLKYVDIILSDKLLCSTNMGSIHVRKLLSISTFSKFLVT